MTDMTIRLLQFEPRGVVIFAAHNSLEKQAFFLKQKSTTYRYLCRNRSHFNSHMS